MLQQFLTSLDPVIPLVGARSRPTGLVAGTLIRTSAGEFPVEYLLAGDLIETAGNGIVELRGTSLIEAREVDVVMIPASAMGDPLARPAHGLVVPINQQVLVHDWRAQVLYGQDAMLTPASSLVDDVQVIRQTRARLRLIRLHFDAPQVIWADGLQVASAKTCAPQIHPGLLH
ncbi:Hint domain-containing protein [Pararhodobacter sp.]|uniref:Hint domain-containing protein n=1 Tax=Pararhodobacter sp. TaxID=2127056 RepID=UPI002AFECC52|nr:Hint domain-containing protein [Pararhodobacter sp.]